MKQILIVLLFSAFMPFAHAQIQPGEPYYKQWTTNTDVRGIVERIDRFIFEIGQSASSRVSALSTADLKRIEDFHAALILYRNVITSLPVIDAPHSHPLELTVQFVTENFEKNMFNIGLRDLIALYVMLSIEMSSSQSAELASGLLPADLERFDILMQRIQEYTDTYLKAAQPADTPENRVFENQSRRGT